MNKRQVSKVRHGVYRIYYKGHGGGYSLTSVGSNEQGERWFAPANWLHRKDFPTVPSYKWSLVERVELIEEKNK